MSKQNYYPERAYFINEEPLSFSQEKDPELTLDQLKTYYASLNHQSKTNQGRLNRIEKKGLSL